MKSFCLECLMCEKPTHGGKQNKTKTKQSNNRGTSIGIIIHNLNNICRTIKIHMMFKLYTQTILKTGLFSCHFIFHYFISFHFVFCFVLFVSFLNLFFYLFIFIFVYFYLLSGFYFILFFYFLSLSRVGLSVFYFKIFFFLFYICFLVHVLILSIISLSFDNFLLHSFLNINNILILPIVDR